MITTPLYSTGSPVLDEIIKPVKGDIVYRGAAKDCYEVVDCEYGVVTLRRRKDLD